MTISRCSVLHATSRGPSAPPRASRAGRGASAGLPLRPKSKTVGTSGAPKWRIQMWLTATRAASGLSRLVTQFASAVRRPVLVAGYVVRDRRVLRRRLVEVRPRRVERRLLRHHLQPRVRQRLQRPGLAALERELRREHRVLGGLRVQLRLAQPGEPLRPAGGQRERFRVGARAARRTARRPRRSSPRRPRPPRGATFSFSFATATASPATPQRVRRVDEPHLRVERRDRRRAVDLLGQLRAGRQRFHACAGELRRRVVRPEREPPGPPRRADLVREGELLVHVHVHAARRARRRAARTARSA